MTPSEAYELILQESVNGIAYLSRMGNYGTPERFHQIIDAINLLQKELRGRTEVSREWFAALFVLGNQIDGNVAGAIDKGLSVPDWLLGDGIASLNEALYAIFEDHNA